MKVKFEDQYKLMYTVREYEQAKAVIESEKDDSFTAKEWAEMALNCLTSGMKWTAEEVVKAEARTCRNPRIKQYHAYAEDSGCMDVSIEATGIIWGDFGKGSTRAYVEFWTKLSDLWQYGNESEYSYHDIGYTLFPME